MNEAPLSQLRNRSEQLVSEAGDAVYFASADLEAPHFEVHCKMSHAARFEHLLAGVPHQVVSSEAPEPAQSQIASE